MYGTITKHLTDLKFSITRVAIGVLRWYAGKSAASNLRLICSIRFVINRQTATANTVRRLRKIMRANISLCLVAISSNQALIFDPDSDPEREKPVRTA